MCVKMLREISVHIEVECTLWTIRRKNQNGKNKTKTNPTFLSSREEKQSIGNRKQK